jgi:hypothetical protein
MTDQQVFRPPRNHGLILHVGIFLLVAAGIVALMIQIFLRPVGWSLVLYLVGSLLLIALLPFIAYRGYALLHASYTIERDGLRIRWGLRSEDVPLTEVLWVREASDLVVPLRLPRFSLPGAILGESNHQELGRLEFIASDASSLVIVSTFNKTLILSPEDAADFTRCFQRVIEMGSLAPISAHTAVPAAFFSQVFKDKLGRVLVPVSAALAILLLLVTSLLIPFKELVPLRYDRTGQPLEAVASSRLLLLPVIGVLMNLADLIGGFYAYRKPDSQTIAYFLWAAGIVTSLLLLLAVVLLTGIFR